MSADISNLSGWHKFILVFLRFALGWHLFYQGYGKLISSYWTSAGYLNASWGPFRMIAQSETFLWIADYTMMWSLVILGLCLMLGLFSRLTAWLSAFLLLMIFVAIPPLDYTGFVMSTNQGTELYVDKTFIEILALMVVGSFKTGRVLGLDVLVNHWRINR